MTSQFYLPDEISREVYQDETYLDRGEQDTPVDTDRFFLNAEDAKQSLMASVSPADSGYLAELRVVV